MVPALCPADGAKVMGEVSVTGTREAQPLAETPASIGSVKGETLSADRPTHPAQIMGQMPGVAVAVTNGEGHSTAIRQPFTTGPLYLFLEDGVPSRSTGFFNHNALYELNIPQAGGIEVIKGPGTALYGSDAIAGVINVLTRTPPSKPEFALSADAGEHGWRRALLGGGNASGSDAWRADLNLTSTDGWRDKTAYDRRSGTFRWDHSIGAAAMLKTIVGFSEIDQETGANSPLIRGDYESNPTRNYLPIAFRKVSALRVNTTYEREFENALLSVTPYFRDNSMDLLATFRLRFDPTVATTENRSYGLMAKWRQDFAPMRARLIAGVDLDVSPGGREENFLNVTTVGTGASQQFVAYTVGARVYDYDVTFRGASPYLHGEISPTDRLRVTAGLRYDHLGYRFRNNLPAAAVAAGGRFYGQAGDARVTFNHLSPKLGATYALGQDTHVFASFNHGFRAPSEGQLFRPARATTAPLAQAQAQASLGLKPVKANQVEIGIRGQLGGVSYDASIYDLRLRDDILSFQDLVAGTTTVVNAGKTRHRGIEVGLGIPIGARFRADAALSYSKQTYVDWVVGGAGGGVLSGKEIESAPRVLANARLTWMPAAGNRLQLEWVRIGSYWLDPINSGKYEGHDLLNLRGNWAVTPRVSLFGSVHNLADRRYADSAGTATAANTPVLSPGLPRTLYAGVEAKW